MKQIRGLMRYFSWSKQPCWGKCDTRQYPNSTFYKLKLDFKIPFAPYTLLFAASLLRNQHENCSPLTTSSWRSQTLVLVELLYWSFQLIRRSVSKPKLGTVWENSCSRKYHASYHNVSGDCIKSWGISLIQRVCKTREEQTRCGWTDQTYTLRRLTNVIVQFKDQIWRPA